MFEYELTVTRKSIDENQHANNVRFVQWMQDAAVAHSNALGWTLSEYEKINAAWIVRRHEIDYFNPAFLGDIVIVRTWVKNFRRIRCARCYEIVEKREEKCLAQASTVWVFWDTAANRPKVIPEAMKLGFKPDSDL